MDVWGTWIIPCPYFDLLQWILNPPALPLTRCQWDLASHASRLSTWVYSVSLSWPSPLFTSWKEEVCRGHPIFNPTNLVSVFTLIHKHFMVGGIGGEIIVLLLYASSQGSLSAGQCGGRSIPIADKTVHIGLVHKQTSGETGDRDWPRLTN